ncbi:serine protease snake-like [Eurosta solidaginis]|uniref:serine protease snake-like n=1 Tax=Eurosta solidaginis TaxID=178769 RepID=UPI0035309E06
MICLWNFSIKCAFYEVLKILIFFLYLAPLIASCYIEQECFTLKNLKGNYYTIEEMKNLSQSRQNYCDGSCVDNNIELICCPYQGNVEQYRLLHQACLDAHLPFELIPLGALSYHKEYPFMAALGWSVRHGIGPEKIIFRCSATMIEYRYLITSAHCLNEFNDQPIVVRPGGFNLNSGSAKSTDYEIDQIIVHPNYEYPSLDNDIAIIRIKHRYIGDITTVSRTCIWYGPLEETPVIAIGYGDAKFVGTSSRALLEKNLSTITNEECSAHYENVNSTQICAKDLQNSQSNCQGDSGGPIIMYDVFKDYQPIAYLVGIQSFGDGCDGGTPGVYTRVSEYYDWIEDVVFK